MNKLSRFCTGLALAVLLAPAGAGILYSTGQDANLDGKDDQFTVNGNSAYLVTQTAKGWPQLPNSAITSGRYISWDPIQSGRYSNQLRDAQYDYAFQFNWAGADMRTDFRFRWVSDDYLTDVLLNGVSLGVSNVGASQVWKISNTAEVSGAVAAGLNTILFRLNNSGGGASGLAADFEVKGDATLPPAEVPEPSAIALSLLGIGLLALRRRS
jgi:hypothetical protein